jgi:hypothetical protein
MLSSKIWVQMGIKLLKVSANLTCRAWIRLQYGDPAFRKQANG